MNEQMTDSQAVAASILVQCTVLANQIAYKYHKFTPMFNLYLNTFSSSEFLVRD